MTELLSTDLYKLVQARHGRFLCNPMDTYIGRSMIEYGEFSENEWIFLSRLIGENAVVIEAGANMGTLTVPFAKTVGLGGMVYAFEPQLSIFQQLCANLALNDLLNVQAFNAGCGSEAGQLSARRLQPNAKNNFGGMSLKILEADSGPKIRIERLDDVIDPPRLTLIKADVEGMEIDVLKGAAGLIGQFRPFLYLEAHQEDAPPLFRHLYELDYQIWWHQPFMFSPKNFFGKSENLFGNTISRNVLALPAERKIKVEGLREVAGEDDYPSKWTR